MATIKAPNHDANEMNVLVKCIEDMLRKHPEWVLEIGDSPRYLAWVDHLRQLCVAHGFDQIAKEMSFDRQGWGVAVRELVGDGAITADELLAVAAMLFG